MFYTERDGNPELYVMNPDGTNQRNLTQNADTVYESAWSPDGSRLAFYSTRSGRFELYTMNPDGSDVQQVTESRYHNAWPAWSPKVRGDAPPR